MENDHDIKLHSVPSKFSQDNLPLPFLLFFVLKFFRVFRSVESNTKEPELQFLNLIITLSQRNWFLGYATLSILHLVYCWVGRHFNVIGRNLILLKAAAPGNPVKSEEVTN